ncbi:hypothetical protein BS17DRAFT_694961, partial [Gyrodon lividus]
YRRYLFNVLVRLSKETGYCPTSLYLSEGAVKDLVSQAQGGFGLVHKGNFGSRIVAVKALNRDIYTSFYAFKKEAIVWRYLRHPNCLPFYGVYDIPRQKPRVTALVSP